MSWRETPTSPATAPGWAETGRSTTVSWSSGSSPAISAAPAPIRSSTACGRRSRRYLARRFSSRRRKTSTSAAAWPVRSINTPCRIRTSRSSTTGRRECSPNCRSCRCCATWPPISRRAAAWCPSSSTATRPRASAFNRRPSTRRSTMPSASARPRSSSPRPTATTWCSRSRPRCRAIRPRCRSST